MTTSETSLAVSPPTEKTKGVSAIIVHVDSTGTIIGDKKASIEKLLGAILSSGDIDANFAFDEAILTVNHAVQLKAGTQALGLKIEQGETVSQQPKQVQELVFRLTQGQQWRLIRIISAQGQTQEFSGIRTASQASTPEKNPEVIRLSKSVALTVDNRDSESLPSLSAESIGILREAVEGSWPKTGELSLHCASESTVQLLRKAPPAQKPPKRSLPATHQNLGARVLGWLRREKGEEHQDESPDMPQIPEASPLTSLNVLISEGKCLVTSINGTSLRKPPEKLRLRPLAETEPLHITVQSLDVYSMGKEGRPSGAQGGLYNILSENGWDPFNPKEIREVTITGKIQFHVGSQSYPLSSISVIRDPKIGVIVRTGGTQEGLKHRKIPKEKGSEDGTDPISDARAETFPGTLQNPSPLQKKR